MYYTKNINLIIFCSLILISLSIFDGCSTPPQQQPTSISRPSFPIIKEQQGVRVPTIPLPPIPKNVKLHSGTRDWQYIVIHHSASKSGNAAEFDKFHRVNNGWNRGLGYDFVIGNGKGATDGKIEVGPRWIKQIDGAHAGVKKYNRYGIGICLVGNFEKTSPSKKQVASLVSLIRYLQKRYNIPSGNVILHRHVKTTACPGTKFPYFEILSNIHI